MSRRGPGEGTIYQREDGRWEGLVTLGYQDGKRQRKSVYGKTRREVQERLDAIRRDLAAGQSPAGERLTVSTYLDRWIEDVRPKLRARTHKRYADILRLHVSPTLGHTGLRQASEAGSDRRRAGSKQEPERLRNRRVAVSFRTQAPRWRRDAAGEGNAGETDIQARSA